MKYLYILLIYLILFYIIYRYFEKYYSQENFDPSLVPVSSIITLAKVAQKIVDGNGTLTNPANLNIGTPNNKGNLLVTGDSTTNGDSTVGGSLGVTGATTVGGTLGVTGASTIGGTLGVTGATNVGGTLGVTGATTVGGTLGVNGVTTIGATSTVGETTSLNINGALNFTNAGTFSIKENGNTVVQANSGGALIVKDSIFVSNLASTGNANWATKIDAAGNITAQGTVKGGNISLTKGFASASSATDAELSSDTGSYKNLMILGNTSRGGGIRNIGMWDNVAISGVLSVGGMSYEGTATTGKVNIGGVTTMKGYGSLAGGCTIEIPAGAYKFPIHLNFRWSDGNNSSYNSLIHLWNGTGPSGTGGWRAGYQAGDCCFPDATWGNADSPNCSIPAKGANSTYVYSVEYVGI